MGSFRVSNSTEVLPLGVQVYIDGYRRSDCYCTQRTLGMGVDGSTVSILMPSADWDGGKYWLRGKPITVRAGYNGYTRPIFHGYVSRVIGATDSRTIEIEAMSLIGWASKVYLGQGLSSDEYVAEYPEKALKDGELVETGWNVKEILRDIWSNRERTWRGGGGSLPSGWRAKLKLGSLSVLGRAWNEFPLGDITFRQTTLADALEHLLGIVGTVSFREDFLEGGDTRLIFFELGDPSAPIKNCRVARAGMSIAGTNVLSVNHEEGADDIRTRMIGLGDRKKYVVSIDTEHATAPLVKDWDSSLESAVLNNPEAAKKGKQAPGDDTRAEFSEVQAQVFRRYKLPDEVRQWIIEKDLGIELTDGRKLPIQVWKIPRLASFDTDTWTSVLATEPVLLEGVQFDLENWTFTLKEPAINFVGGTVDGSANIVDTYEEATVGITLCLAKGRLSHDTGVNGSSMDLDGIDGDGLVEIVTNDSFGFLQITDETWDTAWVYTDSDGWTKYDAETSIQDDEQYLREYTEGALREKADVRANYTITTPWWTDGYRLGDRVRLLGQNDFVFGTHQIKSISDTLGHDHSTTFSTDNGVPLIANQVLSTGGD